MRKSEIFKNGFTLLELLVVTAILGILVGIATSVFIGILRSQNKTSIENEARQNANLAMSLLERDVRSAQDVTCSGVPCPGTGVSTITLTTGPGQTITWTCVPQVPPLPGPSTSNGYIQRTDSSGLPPQTLTNTDTATGVNIICDNPNLAPPNDPFVVTGAGARRLVSFGFIVEQGVLAPTRADYKIRLPFATTVGTRVF